MSFEDDLRLLTGPDNDVGLEHIVGGVIRVTIKTPIRYDVLDPLLRQHDKTLFMTGENGTIELHPLCDVHMSLGATSIAAATTKTVTSGAVCEVTKGMPTATTVDIAALVALPNVLSVYIASGQLIINEILASDIKNGLAHLKRKGKLLKCKTRLATKWPTMSASLRMAKAKRRYRWLSW